MKLTRIDEAYAYGDCTAPPSPVQKHVGRVDCGNTVKFGPDGSEGVCPACGTVYIADGDKATIAAKLEPKGIYAEGADLVVILPHKEIRLELSDDPNDENGASVVADDLKAWVVENRVVATENALYDLLGSFGIDVHVISKTGE